MGREGKMRALGERVGVRVGEERGRSESGERGGGVRESGERGSENG